MANELNVSFGGGKPVVPSLAPAPDNWLAALALLNFDGVFEEAESQVSHLSQLTVDTSFDPFPLEEFFDPREHLPDIEDLHVLNTAMDDGSDIEDNDNLSVISLNFEVTVYDPSS
jgi:hypothetical protein